MAERYKITDDNCLLVIRNNKEIKPQGKFLVDNHNRLFFWLNEPDDWRRKYGFPKRIEFIGNWKLNPNHDLELRLNRASELSGRDTLALKGNIVSVSAQELVFEINTVDKRGLSHVRLIKLSGSWQADQDNRLTFKVKKKGLPDTLTLDGEWQLNKDQQITYIYEKVNLKTRSRAYNTLTFQGFWYITNRNRMSYVLGTGTKSAFDFRVALESPNLYPQQGAIKYRLGIGVSKRRGKKDKIICLYGAWKFSRKLGLVFETEYNKGRIHSQEFGGEINLSQKDKFGFTLLNSRREPLGINLIFTRRFLKKLDAEAFAKLKRKTKESGIELGVKIPF
ncbi:MAG: hypothetical protein ABIG46_07325 [Candidatus Omnitrophota bacterium]